ncbi:MAG: radical SAM protein, partial [Candidatus Sumerlaeaceae bacterium]|nr:radical SAM protein [Candidatus Sumerlaeaceae bacterium]
MGIRQELGSLLERFGAGRYFKRRVRWNLETSRPAGPCPPPRIAHLRFIHVEPSFLCNLECQMCPRLIQGHQEGLMSPECFERLVPIFPFLDAVVLTGFGEPFINPHLPEFIATIRGAGARPCLSTNGTLLDEKRAVAVLSAGLQHIQFSIDAGTAETFERIRAGAKWEKVLGNARRFHELRRHGGFNEVETGWVFILMRDNWRELPLAVRHAAEIGFDLFTAKLLERRALAFEQEQDIYDIQGTLQVDPQEFTQVLHEAREIACQAGMNFVVHEFFAGYEGACMADPLRGVFVDWMGNVTPCCHLPVRDEMGHYPQHSFGNVLDSHIFDILAGQRAQEFWNQWRART